MSILAISFFSSNIKDFLTNRSKGIGNSLQRGVMDSRFDHIAVAIRTSTNKAEENNSILIFESIGGGGVQLVSWGKFKTKNWHSLYNK